MTRDAQKELEQQYVQFASNFFGDAWEICSRESPDFAVTCCRVSFGLGIREISADIESKVGSRLKRGEGERKRRLDVLRKQFHINDNTPLKVEFLLNFDDYGDDDILSVLLSMNLGKNPKGYQSCFEFLDGGKIYATHAFTDHWVAVKDAVGWVLTDRTTEQESLLKQIFENAINQKAQKN